MKSDSESTVTSETSETLTDDSGESGGFSINPQKLPIMRAEHAKGSGQVAYFFII